MAKQPDRLPFTPLGEFVVTKKMKVNGRTYEVGEDFPVKKLALARRKIRVLYDGKFITMKGDYEPDEPEADETPPAELTAGEGEFVFDPDIHELVHEDKEYWIVEDGVDMMRVRAPVGRDLAEATEATLVKADEILEWAEDED